MKPTFDFHGITTAIAVRTLAEKYEKTPAQVMLRYLTQKGATVIPRSAQPAHIQ